MTEKVTKLIVPGTSTDTADIEGLWLKSELGDGITDAHWHTVRTGKPREFFRVHPEKDYRRRTEIYVRKPEGQVEEEYYIIAPEMRGRVQEARPSTLVTYVYRDGSPGLWAIMHPRAGEKDNSAWTSARAAARDAIDGWVKLVWVRRSYQTRNALAGYAPDPDWKKLPSFNELVEIAFGPHGIIRDENHPIFRELIGAPAKASDNDGDL